MIKITRKMFRAETVLNEMMSRGGAFWWTLTTPDVVNYSEISKRWRRVRHYLSRKYSPFCYIQNFEIHPKGHGWHIHFICDSFIDVRRHFSKMRKFGFGRVSCSRVYSNGITDYLVKHAFKPVRANHRDSSSVRIRLLNVSRTCNAPLSRFVVCGGNTGLLRPDKYSSDSLQGQFLAHTYGLPVLPRFKSSFLPFDIPYQREFDFDLSTDNVNNIKSVQSDVPRGTFATHSVYL